MNQIVLGMRWHNLCVRGTKGALLWLGGGALDINVRDATDNVIYQKVSTTQSGK